MPVFLNKMSGKRTRIKKFSFDIPHTHIMNTTYLYAFGFTSEPRKKKKEKAPWQKDDNYEGMTDDEFDESSYLQGRLTLPGKASGDIPQKSGKIYAPIQYCTMGNL